MKNKLKSLIAVTVLGAATVGLYSSGIAADNAASQSVTATTAAVPTQPHRFHCSMWMHRHHGKGPWYLGLNRDKHLTEADARIITEAALLMRGHHNLQVGQIDTKITQHGRKFYLINIVNSSNKAVSRVVLNSKNGHIFPFHVHHKLKFSR